MLEETGQCCPACRPPSAASSDRRGTTAIEYALFVALISVAAITVLPTVGQQIQNVLTPSPTRMTDATRIACIASLAPAARGSTLVGYSRSCCCSPSPRSPCSGGDVGDGMEPPRNASVTSSD